MVRQLLVVLSLFACGQPLWAAEDDPDPKLKVLMHRFALEFAKMSPYLASESEFKSKEGQQVVTDSLKVLEAKLKSAPPEPKLGPGFRVSYSLLSDHVSQTLSALTDKEYDLARMRMNGLGNLCASCHMQAPKLSTYTAFEFVTGKREDISFASGEFLFVIRRFDEALNIFDRLVRTYPSSGATSDQLQSIYRRKLAILAGVYRDPVLARRNLTEDLKNKSLPVDVRRNVESWIQSLKQWKGEKKDLAKLSNAELLAYVDSNLSTGPGRKIAPGHPELLKLLRYSGLLYERLYKNPAGSSAQELLYSVAMIDRSLSPLYWYSLSEIYLKECLVRYPKSPTSKKCFTAYESGMQERYAGRRMPESVRKSIEALKDYI